MSRTPARCLSPFLSGVAPPQGLKPVDVTENTLTLKWEPPTVRPDNYILSYVPLAAGRPTQPPKRLELPAAPERVTLEDLESNTRYRIILITRRGGESSRPTSITATTIGKTLGEDHLESSMVCCCCCCYGLCCRFKALTV